MKLEDYFEIKEQNDIRIKGTRVGIETVIDDYLNGTSPEEIAIRYHSLNIEQIYATITYYFHNKNAIDKYLKEGRDYAEAAWREQQLNPPPVLLRLKKIKDERQKDIVTK